jgi:hypothetical protein
VALEAAEHTMDGLVAALVRQPRRTL